MRRAVSYVANMCEMLQLPWSTSPTPAEKAYKAAGLMNTKGTLYLLPPSDSALRASFESLHKGTKLSVGGKALCKHYEREGGSVEHGVKHAFWTLPMGSSENKSMMARRTLDEILENARWRNVMKLHPGVAVYEVRNERGYGMRWTLEIEEQVDGDAVEQKGDVKILQTFFRGFLEPIKDEDLQRLAKVQQATASEPLDKQIVGHDHV